MKNVIRSSTLDKHVGYNPNRWHQIIFGVAGFSEMNGHE